MQKILIIDDDPAGSQLLATLLEFEGYQPLRLENWRNPVSEVERHRPDLVLMDVYLRTSDGFELLNRLRAHPDPDVAGTPVLMMSAEDHGRRCIREGANGFVEKPFDIQILVDAIRKIEEEDLSKN